jgi:hypothetical protein
MKKNLLLGFVIMFLLSTSAFAGISDPKSGSDKSPSSNNRENKLSDEEVSRLSKRAETDNLNRANVSNDESSNSAKSLKSSQQIIVEGRRHHHGYYMYGGGGLLLLIILVIILV